jgi:hypothetical protein
MKAQKTVSHVDTAVTPASYVPKLRRFSIVGHIDMPNYPRPMFKTGELNTHRGVVAASSGGGGSGFNSFVTVQDTLANILLLTPAVGVIAFVNSGSTKGDLLIYDGTHWQIYVGSVASVVTDALLTEGGDFIMTENNDNLQFEG